jgi:ABC-type multidrug transport system fused ATPase/permease subunit
MQEGEIKEEGNFEELIKAKGIFATMWEEQTL